jgi:hypothetical protein
VAPYCDRPCDLFRRPDLGDYVLSPHLVGRRIHLNAVWVIFALFAFGYLFGFVGLLIAVPLAAAIGVLMRFAMRQCYASQLYAAVPAAASAYTAKPTVSDQEAETIAATKLESPRRTRVAP